jgi:hypothetical protein
MIPIQEVLVRQVFNECYRSNHAFRVGQFRTVS